MCYVSIVEYFDENDVKPGDLDTIVHQIEGVHDIKKEFADNEMGSQVLIDIFSLFLLGDDQMIRKVQESTPDGGTRIIGADSFRLILPTQFAVSFTYSMYFFVIIYHKFFNHQISH
jgi:hypothetical protein